MRIDVVPLLITGGLGLGIGAAVAQPRERLPVAASLALGGMLLVGLPAALQSSRSTYGAGAEARGPGHGGMLDASPLP